MKRILLMAVLFLVSLATIACTQEIAGNPTLGQTYSGIQPTPVVVVEGTVETVPVEAGSPVATATKVDRGNVYIDSYEIIQGDSANSVELVLRGSLPTPCHKLHVDVQLPDEQNRIHVDVYSTVSSTRMCKQVLQPATDRLALTKLADGIYTLSLNLEKEVEFSVPFK